MYIDHVVIWVENTQRALDFYAHTLGFESVRENEYLEGKAAFPSVRINEKTIFDVMARDQLPSSAAGEGSAGSPINHICLSMTHKEYSRIVERLKASGVGLTSAGKNVFGAQGQAVCAAYFTDPDGNVIEIRYYDN